ncbi:MAG: hypothetical protein JXQ91_04745 [Vannielia sp.]|uniref:hypothetical protein n=1 Tax=Rhodobacterales TaxID=204455 RepID=UPI002094AA53|nr:hypothetical protein [Oceanicola sp. 502str15]MCO6381725.1 hypothetical protein [Oceanicola sp. 502str15]
MAPKKSAKPEMKTEERAATDKRQRESASDIWDISPDGDTDQRYVITDWASI